MSERMTCVEAGKTIAQHAGRDTDGSVYAIVSAMDTLRAADEVMAKLPRTKDGVCVVPGSSVFVRVAFPYGGVRVEERGVEMCMETLDEDNHWTSEVEGGYSTREAAEAAKEATDGK